MTSATGLPQRGRTLTNASFNRVAQTTFTNGTGSSLGVLFAQPNTTTHCGSPFPEPIFQDCVRYSLYWAPALRFRAPYNFQSFGVSGASHFMTDALHPDIGPDGTLIYTRYATSAGPIPKIWITDTSGDPGRRLTTTADEISESRAVWSPTGDRIAFSSSGSIHLIQPDGSNEVALTTGVSDTHPTWSPDGTQIVFQRGGIGDPGLFIVDVSGGTPRLLGRGRQPAWRPVPAEPAQAAPENQPPLAAADVLDTLYGRPGSVNVLDNDSDPEGMPLSVLTYTQGARGHVSCEPSGACTYAPAAGFAGEDHFTYTTRDANDGRAMADVHVNIASISPGVAIASPPSGLGVPTGSTVDVTGTSSLAFSDPGVNVLYVIDAHSGMPGSYGGVPLDWFSFTWPNGVPAGLCSELAALGRVNTVVDCYSQVLAARLRSQPAVESGVLMFADDILGLGVSADLVLMPKTSHPWDYRANTFFVDMSPASGFQRFAAGAAVDGNRNGMQDVEELLGNVWQPFTEGKSCTSADLYGGGDLTPTPTGTTLFGPLEQPATPSGGESYYPDGVVCHGGRRTDQTYDFALQALNNAFATQPANQRNVAYFFSNGRSLLSEDENSPLRKAARAGTVIHTFAPVARTERYPVDVVILADTRTTTTDQDALFSARLAEVAEALVASELDFRVVLAATKNLLSGTPLAFDSERFGFAQLDDYTDPMSGAPLSPHTGLLRKEADLHIVALNTTGDMRGNPSFIRSKSFFLHAISPRGPEYCPGSTNTSQAFLEAVERRGLSLLTCSESWLQLLDAFENPPYNPYAHAVEYGEPGTRSLGSCASGNPLAKIAAATGGSCTELRWDRSALDIPLPQLPHLGISNLPTDGIERVELARAGDAPVLAAVDAAGRFSAPVPGMAPGPNVITATLYARDGLTASAQVTVFGQEGFNAAPESQPDVLEIEAGETKSIDVLANDTDPDGDALTFVSVSAPESGEIECSAEGTCTYEASASFDGEVVVEYTVADGRGGRGSAALTLRGNRAPLVPVQTAAGVATKSIAISLMQGVSDPDGDSLQFVHVLSGTVPDMQSSCSVLGACELVYPATFSGIARFTFLVRDGRGAETIGEAVITVLPAIGDPAVQIRHGGTFRQGEPATYDVQVSNFGAATSVGVYVALQLPALGYLGFEGDGWVCERGALVECAHHAPIEPGASLPLLHIRVLPTADAIPETIASVVLQAAADQAFHNNYASDVTEVRAPEQDVGIEFSAVGAFEICGGGQFEAVVRETGGVLGNADVLVRSTLPQEIALVGVSGDGWNCTSELQSFSCTHAYPSVPGQPLASLFIDVTPGVSATVEVQVEVDTAGDANDANDRASASITAQPPLEPTTQSLILTPTVFGANFVTLAGDGSAPSLSSGMWGASGPSADSVARNFSQFNLSSIPPSSRIASARHRAALFSHPYQGSLTGRESAAFAVLGPYDRNTVTWETQPAADYDTAYGVVPSWQVPSSGAYYRDITSLVQRWVDAPAQNFGMVLAGLPEAYTPTAYEWAAWYGPNHYVVSDRPTLEIAYQRALLPDADGDVAFDCIDNCPGLANPDQVDGDADGRGDACDNCIDAFNPEQADANGDGAGDACQPIIDIRSITSDGSVVTADILIDDPNDDPLSGSLRVYSQDPSVPSPVAVVVDTLVSCGNQYLNLELNGNPIASVLSGSHCTCSPPQNRQRFTGSAVVQAFDLGGGPNEFRMSKPSNRAALAWYAVTVEFSDGSAQRLCVYDRAGGQGNCRGTNLCSEGYTFSPVTASASLAPLPAAVVDVFVDDYTHDALSRTVDLTGYPDGQYFLHATTTDGFTPMVEDEQAFFVAGESTLEINPGPDLVVLGREPAALPVCGEVAYAFDVDNRGSHATTGPVQLSFVAPGGLVLQSSAGTGWICAVLPSSAECTYDAAVVPGEVLPQVQLIALVSGAVGDPIELHANAQTAGDASVANDIAILRGTVGENAGQAFDEDADGLPDCVDHCSIANGTDGDGDGVCDADDNCPALANTDQVDGDGDGVGDACACTDTDSDRFCDSVDNCPAAPNLDQADGDGDGLGDLCDACPTDASNDGSDGDGACDDTDNCVGLANPAQTDVDGDGIGDACDACAFDATNDGSDGDGACDDIDNCLVYSNPDQVDSDFDGQGDACDVCPGDATNDGSDGDGVCDDVDNCLGVANTAQGDADADALGDACDFCPTDPTNDGSDGDGVCDDVDNCVGAANAEQTDGDGDGLGDACDACPTDPTNDGSDGDGVCDDVDNCLALANADQLDSDADGIGDACDACPFDATNDFSDGDGVCDDVDNCLGTANFDQRDVDADGRGDVCDICPIDPTDDGSDGDGVCDDVDNCVGLANPDQYDGDGDGRGQVCDICPNDPTNDGSDGDGVCDDVDNCLGVANASQLDTDLDGLGDACDACPHDATNDGSDGDGVCDDIDNCLGAANPAQSDADGDRRGDACDICPNDPTDDGSDGDGVCDDIDNCVALANPTQEDADSDARGDACDACPHDPANDADQDGVCGDVDLCTGSGLDVLESGLNPNHYAQLDTDPEFEVGAAGANVHDHEFCDATCEQGESGGNYTMADTRGCTCLQIVELRGLGAGHRRHGCSPGVVREWVESGGAPAE